MGAYDLIDQEMKDREHFMREYMVEVDGKHKSVWDLYQEHQCKMIDYDAHCADCGRFLWQVGVLHVHEGKTYCDKCISRKRG